MAQFSSSKHVRYKQIHCFRRGISIPYARSLLSSTMRQESKVPGKPKMKATIRHPLLELFWARMPAKERLAKIQTAKAPPSPASQVVVPVLLAQVASGIDKTRAIKIANVKKLRMFIILCNPTKNSLGDYAQSGPIFAF
ncbi:MAG TPA: hypothetical protein VI636_16945 [Candidatus Angelobacter sp.]